MYSTLRVEVADELNTALSSNYGRYFIASAEFDISVTRRVRFLFAIFNG